MALDGDVDFEHDAVEKLLDLMKNDKKLGAACGRIHPMGKGITTSFSTQIFSFCFIRNNIRVLRFEKKLSKSSSKCLAGSGSMLRFQFRVVCDNDHI